MLAQAVAEAAGMPFEYYLRDAVCVPLEMAATTLPGSPAADGVSTAADLSRFAAELQAPTLLDPSTVAAPPRSPSPAWTGCCPASAGSAPTTGGWASRSATASRRTGPGRPARRGRSGTSGRPGTFLWVDPDARRGRASR